MPIFVVKKKSTARTLVDEKTYLKIEKKDPECWSEGQGNKTE